MAFNLRRNIKNFNDVQHNFHILDWLLQGHLDSSHIRDVDALRVSGMLEADQITIGTGTEFQSGYDYRGKVTQLSDEGLYTGKIYANQIEVAGFEEDEEGTTIIKGGYINADVIEAKSIEAEKLKVSDLSAISAYFTELYTGSASDFVYIYEEENKPYINFYDDNTLRMGLTSDRLQLFTTVGAYGGRVMGEEEPDFGLPSITMESPFVTRIMSEDPLENTFRSSGFATRVHPGDLLLPSEAQSYAVDQHSTNEIMEIEVTSGASSTGDFVLTLDNIVYDDISVAENDNINSVAQKIYDYLDTVQYSQTEIVWFEVLWPAEESGDLSITIDDIEYDDISVVDGDNQNTIAQKIHDYFDNIANFSNDWTLDLDANVVTLTATVDEEKGSHDYSVGDTGCYLTMYTQSGFLYDFHEVWEKVISDNVITLTAIHDGYRGEPELDDNGTGVDATFNIKQVGYAVNSSAYINIHSQGDSPFTPWGNVDLGGITRVHCVNPNEMSRGYRFVKGPYPNGIGIINFICEG